MGRLLPDQALARGDVDSWRRVSMISQYRHVILTGRTSGVVEAETGMLCVWQEIGVDGSPRCFGDLFELTKRRPWYLNTPLVQRGDSGAWVLAVDGDVVQWLGMLIGGSGAQGYACFAENVIDRVQSALSHSLVLP